MKKYFGAETVGQIVRITDKDDNDTFKMTFAISSEGYQSNPLKFLENLLKDNVSKQAFISINVEIVE